LLSPLAVDFQADVNLGAIVELADSLGAAFVVVVLRIDFVIESGCRAGKRKVPSSPTM